MRIVRIICYALSTTLALTVVDTAALADGASASGNARGDFVIGCNTCGHIEIELSGQPDQQAAGPALASVSYGGTAVHTSAFDGYSLAGGAAYAAQAAFEGVLATPLLKARASTDNEDAYLLADPAQLAIGIDLYQASARADTVRRYNYLGAAPASYTFHFGVEGVLGNAQSSLFASAAIYDGSDPFFETGLIDAGYAALSGSGVVGTPTLLSASFSVTVMVEPGDSFYLLGHLGVLAAMTYDSADVAVNAYDTMRVSSISGGAPSLLQAAPVPEPGGASLLLAGLLTLAIIFNRAKARPRAGS